MKRSRKGAISSSDAEGERDPTRFYCPYPQCNRSFAELWRLKVHYRAPPDIRGSGKERGHGTELSHCPKCGKELQPGKHHVGCGQNKNTQQKAAKRIKLEHGSSGQNGFLTNNEMVDMFGSGSLVGQTLVVNQQQLAALQEQYRQQLQHQQQLQQSQFSLQQLPSLKQQTPQSVTHVKNVGKQQMLLPPNMVPVVLGQQPGILVVNSGLQAANYAPIMYNNNTPVQLAQLQLPLMMQTPMLSPSMILVNSQTDAPQQYPLQKNASVKQKSSQFQCVNIGQQQQHMYSEADSNQKEKQGQEEEVGQSTNPQFSLTLENLENQDNIFSDVVAAPLPSMCPSPPPLPEGCGQKEFQSGQLFDFDRCLQESSKNSTNNNNTSNSGPLLNDFAQRDSNPHMEDILQLLFKEENELPFLTTHLHRRTEFEQEVDQAVSPELPQTQQEDSKPNKSTKFQKYFDETQTSLKQYKLEETSMYLRSACACAFVHSSGSSKE